MVLIIHLISLIICAYKVEKTFEKSQQTREGEITFSSNNPVSETSIGQNISGQYLTNPNLLLKNRENFRIGPDCFFKLSYIEPPKYDHYKLSFRISLCSCLPAYYLYTNYKISIIRGKKNSSGNVDYWVASTEGVANMLMNPYDFLVWTFDNLDYDDVVSVIAENKIKTLNKIKATLFTYKGNNCFNQENFLIIE
ncbi:hypothetical protein NUSPORA_01625 [Nucleospora cyclopteri]